ncbi:hypothetical protein ES703_07552 [subsurface metagenome]
MITIVRLENLYKVVKKLEKEYRISIKPGETEEIVNQIFNRPLAFLAAKFFHRLKRSPNFITMFSMAFGVSSGFLFAQGEYPYVLAAVILLELMIIFDCADGQLARMLDKSSTLGKILDGLSDMSTHMSIFYGVAYALYMKTGSIYPFFLGLGAQLTMYLHIFLYDHFKNVFISVARPDYGEKLESLEELKDRSVKEKGQNDSTSIKWLIAKIYYLFYRVESLVVSIGYFPPANNFYNFFPDPERIDSLTREIYYREMRVSMKIWSFLGDTTHLTLFMVFGILDKISLIFPVFIIYTNLYMVFAIFYQRIKFRKLGLEREILWQERFD